MSFHTNNAFITTRKRLLPSETFSATKFAATIVIDLTWRLQITATHFIYHFYLPFYLPLKLPPPPPPFWSKLIQWNTSLIRTVFLVPRHTFSLKLTRLIRTLRNTDTFSGPFGVRNNGVWLYSHFINRSVNCRLVKGYSHAHINSWQIVIPLCSNQLPFNSLYQRTNSPILSPYFSYKSTGEKLLRYQENFDDFRGWISIDISRRIWCWSLLGLKGLIHYSRATVTP